MMCYRDMTFCSYWPECKRGADCPRALTPGVEDAAEKHGYPICRFVDKPECYEESDNAVD